MVVVAILAVELGVKHADLGLAGAVEAQRHQRVGQPLAVSALVEVPKRFKTLKNRNQEFNKYTNRHTPLAVPIGRQIDTWVTHVDAGEVSERGGSWSEVWRLGVGKRLLKG